MRIGLVTLGCDKNTVDNEYLAGLLTARGCEVVFLEPDGVDDALEAVAVLTCGFILDAREQSVEALVSWVERKRATGRPGRVYAAGCLAQRYADDLLKSLPNLDGVVGVGQLDELALLLAGDEKPWAEGRHGVRRTPRVVIDRPIPRRRGARTPHAFLKVSDGCNHRCAFCAIPIMKGRLHSTAVDILVAEARALLSEGVRELVLVAQDVSAYGRDWDRRHHLPELLHALCALDGDFWIRCMYCYPGGITDEVIDLVASEPKVVPYLDIPLQHLDPEMLRSMKRPAGRVDGIRLFERLRERIPGVALRTSMIVGFPGETPAAHRRLVDGLWDLSAQWLGAFPYSREEGTPGAVAPRQVGPAVKERRWREVMEAQAEITRQLNEARVGSPTRVLVERFDSGSRQWVGRSPAEAPEVDGCVFLESRRPLALGSFVDAVITAAQDYDVVARVGE